MSLFITPLAEADFNNDVHYWWKTNIKEWDGEKVDVGLEAEMRFNEEVSKLNNTVVLCISKDLPFAFGRFCAAEGIKNVITASEYKNSNFAEAYKVTLTDGVLKGLFSRAIVALDSAGKVIYTEQVPDIAQEPNYEKALTALKETAKA